MPSGQIAEVIARMAKQISDLETAVNELKSTRSVTTITPPTADGTGLPGLLFSTQSPQQNIKIMFTFIRGIENERNLQ